MIAFRQSAELLHITVSGNCDFALARELLATCKSQMLEGNIKQIEILLEEVTSCNTCTIGAMLLLSELVQGKFQLSVNNSSPDVHHLFESGLLTRHFGSHHTSASQVTACSRCFQVNCEFPGPNCLRIHPVA